MSDPKSDPARLRQAADWHARLGARAITTRSLREFRDWRENPANDAAYQEVEHAWSRSGDLAGDPDILRETEHILMRPRREPGWRHARPTIWALALAAVAAPLLALLALRLADPVYATGVGEQRLVRLADGSRVHVNTDSRVRVDFDRGTRRLVLVRGEAFFDVAHDASRPFIVAAGEAEVRALGTRFGVRRSPEGVRVTLLEGVVRVAAEDAAAWTLSPNQQLTVRPDGQGQVRRTDAALSTSWTTGRLYFRSTPLAQAVAEVNRYGERKIELDAATFAARPVSGVFDIGDTEGFVRAVTALFELRADEASGRTIRLTPAAG